SRVEKTQRGAALSSSGGSRRRLHRASASPPAGPPRRRAPASAPRRAIESPPPHRLERPGAPLPPSRPTRASSRARPPPEVPGAGAAGTAPPLSGLLGPRPVGRSAGSAGQRGSAGSGSAARGRRMYTLLSGLYKYMFQKDEYCILILGLDNAGKTTFLEQSKTRFNKNYKGMSLSKITTTVGLNIGTVDVGKSRLLFWDLGGQEELQSLWDKYYAECHGVIYVIDSTDEERLSESKQAFDLSLNP
uniref:ARF related protein 1 n=1 Tax=Equus asinus TaxID=9793 RepID=A0A9L0JU03_EQUAS